MSSHESSPAEAQRCVPVSIEKTNTDDGHDHSDSINSVGSSIDHAEAKQSHVQNKDSDLEEETPFDCLLPKLEPIEDLERYEKGGYHPVSLGDTFDNERYRVVHKLGHGGSSTVWLARDNTLQRYVSLKILCAEEPSDIKDIKVLDYLKNKNPSHPGYQYISFLYDSFGIDGPNGSHMCLVSEVLGPSLADLVSLGKQLRAAASRTVSRQLVQAVAYLHSEGFCHGDLTAANVAFEVQNFDSWSEDELYSRLGNPKTEHIRTASGKPLSDHFPKYVVQPLSFVDCSFSYLRESIRIIDFGISFHVDNPPTFLGTPPSFLAPEAWFEKAAGKSTDLWALGCTLYTIRSGMILVQLCWGGTPIEAISEISEFLGPLPDRWDRLWFDDFGNPKPREEFPDHEELGPWTIEAERDTQNLHDLVAFVKDEYHGPVARAEDHIEREKLPIEMEIEARGGKVIHPPQKPEQVMDPKEIDSFADLLGMVLTWEPDRRASAEEVAKHPWFEGGFPEAETAEGAPPLFQS